MEDFRLIVFIQVCESGSFTKAANILGISQPAVSQNIAELEKILRTSLFSRRGGSVSITPQGSVFLDKARRVCSAYRDIDILFGTDVPARAVIYASPEAKAGILDKILERLSALYPSLQIEISENGEGADISIISAPFTMDGALAFRFRVLPDDSALSRIVSVIIADLLGRSE